MKTFFDEYLKKKNVLFVKCCMQFSIVTLLSNIITYLFVHENGII